MCTFVLQVKKWTAGQKGWSIVSMFLAVSNFAAAPTGSSLITKFFKQPSASAPALAPAQELPANALASFEGPQADLLAPQQGLQAAAPGPVSSPAQELQADAGTYTQRLQTSKELDAEGSASQAEAPTCRGQNDETPQELSALVAQQQAATSVSQRSQSDSWQNAAFRIKHSPDLGQAAAEVGSSQASRPQQKPLALAVESPVVQMAPHGSETDPRHGSETDPRHATAANQRHKYPEAASMHESATRLATAEGGSIDLQRPSLGLHGPGLAQPSVLGAAPALAAEAAQAGGGVDTTHDLLQAMPESTGSAPNSLKLDGLSEGDPSAAQQGPGQVQREGTLSKALGKRPLEKVFTREPEHRKRPVRHVFCVAVGDCICTTVSMCVHWHSIADDALHSSCVLLYIFFPLFQLCAPVGFSSHDVHHCAGCQSQELMPPCV